MAYADVTSLIGNTPLMELASYAKAAGVDAQILAKLEYFNPAGSAKDRPALYMIRGMEEKGLLAPGGTVIEPTSGNTGIALAAICAARGYKAVFTMPSSMSKERIQLLRAYGAQVILTDAAAGMAGAIAEAEKIKNETPGSVIAGQFENPDNRAAHYATTGPELFRDAEGKLDAFVATVGSGGTLSGAGRYLKEQIPGVKVFAVEPAESPLLSGGTAAPHGIMGIGANFIPDVLDREVYDEVLTASEGEARACAWLLARTEGILAGISSGAALAAAGKLAKRPEFRGKRIAVILPDSGERYLSTGLFD